MTTIPDRTAPPWEVAALFWTYVVTAVAALTIVVLAVVAVRRYRALARVLAAERSRARLMEGVQHRDACTLRDRLAAADARIAVLAAAETELDRALARYARTDPTQEGGSR